MALSPESISMALFCDFENVALGVKDANYQKFDIKRVLERLLLKGSIVVKKAYCDWERYKGFKASMHEANFELIEIPHVRQSGKNSADIRLVVDALDLCYTKAHVDTFVIISGDSDFSPLVSKLRENDKQVIGVGVKQSTSDLLIANCDEFIFYDDLVRDSRPGPRTVQDHAHAHKPDHEQMVARKAQAVEITLETFDALSAEKGDSEKIWASALKQAIKRRKPDFNESYYGFRAFGNLLEEAREKGLLDFAQDEKSGTYVFRPMRKDEKVKKPGRRKSPAKSASLYSNADPAPVAAESQPVKKAENAEKAPRRNSKKKNAEMVATQEKIENPSPAAAPETAPRKAAARRRKKAEPPSE